MYLGFGGRSRPKLDKRVLNELLINAFEQNHDDTIKWKHFPRYWLFLREIHRSPVTLGKASDAEHI